MDNLHALALDLELRKVLFKMSKLRRDLRESWHVQFKLRYQPFAFKLFQTVKELQQNPQMSLINKLGQNAPECMKLNISIQKFSGGDTAGLPLHRGRKSQSWWKAASGGIDAPVSICNKLLAVQNNKTITRLFQCLRSNGEINCRGQRNSQLIERKSHLPHFI